MNILASIGRLFESAVQSFLGLVTLLIVVSGVVFFILGIILAISKGH